MILGYKDRKTEQFANGEIVKKFQGFASQSERRLAILNAATSLDDLHVMRSNRLEALRGDRAGQYSFRIKRRLKRTLVKCRCVLFECQACVAQNFCPMFAARRQN